MPMFSPHTVKFIQETDLVEPVGGGYSGALLYKISRGGQTFFVKVFNKELNITALKEKLGIYQKLKIKTPEIVDCGAVGDEVYKNYVVYNFINGKNLKEYTDAEDFNVENIQPLGRRVGSELLKLKNYQDYDKNLFLSPNISGLAKEVVGDFSILLQDDEASRIIKSYFTDRELGELKNILSEYVHVFDNITPDLIHGDIKRSNIMVDENHDIYLVDIESMQLSYDIMNFRHQITWCLFEDNVREQEFIKGFFDGLYNDARPADFDKQVIFMTIVNFFTESYRLMKRAETDKLSTYASKCQKLFNKLLSESKQSHIHL